MSHRITAEELLAGAQTTHLVPLPAALMKRSSASASDAAATPTSAETAAGGGSVGHVELRPLTVRDVERVVKAAREQHILSSILMVQQSLVAPKLTVEQVGSLPAGVVQFLLEKVNAISGLDLAQDDLERAVKAPLARACFVLAREFGWTPSQCAELTLGQVLLYLEMLAKDGASTVRETQGSLAELGKLARGEAAE